MKKIRGTDEFAEILHKILKIHTKHKPLRFMQLLGNCYGTNDAYWLTNEQLLELLENEYDK